MTATVSITQDPDEWDDWCRLAGLNDVYFSLRYGRIWESQEGGTAVGIRLQSENGSVFYPLLRVPLDRLNEGQGRCDLRVPYDYGGPWFSTPIARQVGRLALAIEFEEVMRQVVQEWNVVTEFGRLHPHAQVLYVEGQEPYAQHHWVDLSRGPEGVLADSHPNQRRNVRAARKAGVEVSFVSSADLGATAALNAATDDFVTLYERSMDRLKATKSFRFTPSTLRAVIALPEVHVATALLDGQVASIALFLRSADTLFYFLGANNRDSQRARPANLLFDEAINMAIAGGFRKLHLGGGHADLVRFKSQIGRHRVPYYLRKRVWNEPASARLIAANDHSADKSFPQYDAD